MNRHAFLYTYFMEDANRYSEWTVFPAITLTPLWRGKAQLVVVRGEGSPASMLVVDEYHLSNRNSAAFWVWAQDWRQMMDELSKDERNERAAKKLLRLIGQIELA